VSAAATTTSTDHTALCNCSRRTGVTRRRDQPQRSCADEICSADSSSDTRRLSLRTLWAVRPPGSLGARIGRILDLGRGMEVVSRVTLAA
jgi:hypothetical protein